MATRIKIGHAGGTKNGLTIVENYNITSLEPSFMLRPISAALAEKSAVTCETGCGNDNIKYSQDYRDTLYLKAKKTSFKLDTTNITETCYTDCSAFMYVCALAGGAKVDCGSWGPNCGNIEFKLTKSNEYEVHRESKYLTSTDYLQRGDILVRDWYKNGSRHTVMVLENGNKVPKISVPTTSIDSSSTEVFVSNFSIFNVRTEVQQLTTDNIKTKVELVKLEKDLETLINSKQYKWFYTLTPLTNASTKSKAGPLTLSNNAFSLNNLIPNTSYILKVSAKDDNVEFTSANVIFTTLSTSAPKSDKITKFEAADKVKGYHVYVKVKDKIKRAILYNRRKE